MKKSAFMPGNSGLPDGLEVTTGNPEYDLVLAHIKKDDSEAGLHKDTDFGSVKREFFYLLFCLINFPSSPC